MKKGADVILVCFYFFRLCCFGYFQKLLSVSVGARGFLTPGGIDHYDTLSPPVPSFSVSFPFFPSPPLLLEVGALDVGPLKPC